MPVISKIGAKSFKVRMLYATIFAVLTLGAVSMIYPFLLMLTGSVSSEADKTYISVYPRFWFEDRIVFRKYVESKYNGSLEYAMCNWTMPIASWPTIGLPEEPQKNPYLEDYRQWLAKECPQQWWNLGHASAGWYYPINARLWRTQMYQRFDGDIDRFRAEFELPIKSWNQVRPPPIKDVRFVCPGPYEKAYAQFATGRPVADRVLLNPDGMFWYRFLNPVYGGRIEGYNRNHGTAHKSYNEVLLDTRVPPGGKACEDDWAAFVLSMSAPAKVTATQPAESVASAESVRPGEIKPHAGLVGDFANFLKGHYPQRALKDAVDECNARIAAEQTADSPATEPRFKSWDDLGLQEYNRLLNKTYATAEDLVKDKFLQSYKIADASAVTMDTFLDQWDAARVDWESFVLARFRLFLAERYRNDAAKMNQAYGLPADKYAFDTVPILQVIRHDWRDFVRGGLNFDFIHLDENLSPAYQEFLKKRYKNDLAKLNEMQRTQYTSFDQIKHRSVVPLPDAPDREAFRYEQPDWDGFLQDDAACPAEAISVQGPRQSFEQFLAKKRGQSPAEVGPVRLPVYEMDAADAMANLSSIRWEMTTRNYKHVLDFIVLHGRGIVNTLIYVVLAIATALIVNPLAAYALSRYKPRSMYSILLFCMATMAFPGEVTMIPGFLLMRRFPLWPLVGALAAFFVAIYLLSKLAPKLPETVRMLVSLLASIFAGVAIGVAMERPNVSLLNTFAALVLPGMGNGFSIFLLKGFFDSLPRELYEAAELDGAGEWTKFWSLSMNLSKPILAVIALGTFTGAYSDFMMALIIIPDQSMWTLMVWIFQLQSTVSGGVVYASLVIAAIPTLLVFTLCQNIIIRGIVVPTEK